MKRLLRPGDLLRRAKGLVDHVGIYIGDGRVLENTPEKGEHVSTIEAFAKGRKIRVSRPPDNLRPTIIANAARIIMSPREFNLFLNNCEHTVMRCATGRSSSPQLQGIIGIGLFAASVLLFSKSGR